MKGFAKVFFLVTMLFAVTSLFATVNEKQSKDAQGYSVSKDVQVEEQALVTDFTFEAITVSQPVEPDFTFEAVVVNYPIEPGVPIPRKLEHGNYNLKERSLTHNSHSYASKEDRSVIIQEAEALPDRSNN